MQIVASLCPQLCGLFSVKLASLLMLLGGVARRDEGGAHVRGEIHMLLVGDPGTGVSSVLDRLAQYVELHGHAGGLDAGTSATNMLRAEGRLLEEQSRQSEWRLHRGLAR